MGHNVLTISDRDVINQNKTLTDITGSKKLQEKIINSYYNFKPDLLILGHADSVSLETIDFFKSKNVKRYLNGFLILYLNLDLITVQINKEFYIKIN